MPIEMTADSGTDVQDFNEGDLFASDGKLTLEAGVLASFLNTLDFSPLFDDADVQPFVETGPVLVSEDADGRVISDLSDELEEDKAEGVMVVEYLDGDIAADFVDEEDLATMLEYYIKHEHPRESLEDRTALKAFSDILEGDDGAIEEKFKAPFKKGEFRTGPMSKVSAGSKGLKRKIHSQRVRMMLAMLHKGVIQRVPKGTGYKGGDYKKDAGYGGGTPKGKKAYGVHAAMNKKTPGKIATAVDPGRRKVVQVIYKNLGKSMPKNWVPPERRGKSSGGGVKVSKKVAVKTGAAKSAAVSKAKGLFGSKGKAVKGKQADVAHVHGAEYKLTEGAGLARAMMGVASRKARPITEQSERKKEVVNS